MSNTGLSYSITGASPNRKRLLYTNHAKRVKSGSKRACGGRTNIMYGDKRTREQSHNTTFTNTGINSTFNSNVKTVMGRSTTADPN